MDKAARVERFRNLIQVHADLPHVFKKQAERNTILMGEDWLNASTLQKQGAEEGGNCQIRSLCRLADRFISLLGHTSMDRPAFNFFGQAFGLRSAQLNQSISNKTIKTGSRTRSSAKRITFLRILPKEKQSHFSFSTPSGRKWISLRSRLSLLGLTAAFENLTGAHQGSPRSPLLPLMPPCVLAAQGTLRSGALAHCARQRQSEAARLRGSPQIHGDSGVANIETIEQFDMFTGKLLNCFSWLQGL
ncbi:hypothetical protein OU993_18020 [Rhizobium sp. SL86]|nr:hypothetical protein [Rhizobium sp. SL86]MCY1667372.1 hypothetical protein [Rhizobium sp. SL86]